MIRNVEDYMSLKDGLYPAAGSWCMEDNGLKV